MREDLVFEMEVRRLRAALLSVTEEQWAAHAARTRIEDLSPALLARFRDAWANHDVRPNPAKGNGPEEASGYRIVGGSEWFARSWAFMATAAAFLFAFGILPALRGSEPEVGIRGEANAQGVYRVPRGARSENVAQVMLASPDEPTLSLALVPPLVLTRGTAMIRIRLQAPAEPPILDRSIRIGSVETIRFVDVPRGRNAWRASFYELVIRDLGGESTYAFELRVAAPNLGR
jgi:hypothetical protein